MIPAITGKVELVYEGEQEGPYVVALHLIGDAVKEQFLRFFPNPDKLGRSEERDPYGVMKAWFAGGNVVSLLNDASDQEYKKELMKVAGLQKFVSSYQVPKKDELTFMELVLHGLSEFNIINKNLVDSTLTFEDSLAGMLRDDDDDDDDDFG